MFKILIRLFGMNNKTINEELREDRRRRGNPPQVVRKIRKRTKPPASKDVNLPR